MKFRVAAILILSSLGLAAASCSSKKATPPSGKKPGTEEEECGEADAKAKKSKTGLTLLATTYDDIKGIIEDNCESCHKAGGPGNLDLTTYKALKASADAVVTTIESDDEDIVMPPGDKLSDANIKKIKAWVADGKLEDDSGEEEESSSGSSSKKSSSDDGCDSKSKKDSDDGELETEGDSESGDEGEGDEGGDEPKEEPFKIDPELYKMFIEPEEMKTCHAQGKTYLRTGTKADPATGTPEDPTPRCDNVNYPAKFKCDEAGVLAAFDNAQIVKDEVAKRKGEGYMFDQCGEAAGKPVVYFVCFAGEDGKCVGQENLKAEGMTIKTSSIGRP